MKAETVQAEAHIYGYTYDTAGRLDTVTIDGITTSDYSYDANGNRDGGTYDDQDRLTVYGSNTYTYTDNGELLTKTNSDGTTTYTYDSLGNLTNVLLPSGDTIEYIIDGQNRRIGKKYNGTLMNGYLYEDQLRITAELEGDGSVESRFIYGSKTNIPDYMIKGGATYRIISDHLGSVRMVIDTSDGSIDQRMDYDEFGNVTSDTSPGFQPFGFAGGLYDEDTGLVRFGARDYDPEVGRWTSKDPIGFGGGATNLYGYVMGNPVNFIDPLGLDHNDVGIMIQDIHERYGLDKPDAIVYMSLPPGIMGRSSRYRNNIELPSSDFTKKLKDDYQCDALYQTLYHEMRHLNALFYQEIIDFYSELFSDSPGPYHQKIYNDEVNIYAPQDILNQILE